MTSQQTYWAWIFVGGGLGSCARYALTRAIQQLSGQPLWTAATMPWGTIAVNVLGCLLIGLLAGLANGHNSLPPAVRFALITGFLGGFTTFSTFAYESFLLFQQGNMTKAVLNIVGSMTLGLLAVLTGFYVARTAFSLR